MKCTVWTTWNNWEFGFGFILPPFWEVYLLFGPWSLGLQGHDVEYDFDLVPGCDHLYETHIDIGLNPPVYGVCMKCGHRA